jgi:hypothetical protein
MQDFGFKLVYRVHIGLQVERTQGLMMADLARHRNKTRCFGRRRRGFAILSATFYIFPDAMALPKTLAAGLQTPPRFGGFAAGRQPLAVNCRHGDADLQLSSTEAQQWKPGIRQPAFDWCA